MQFSFLLSAIITVSAWIDHMDDHYLNYDPYPAFAQFLGWGIELFSVAIVVFYGAYYIVKKWRAGESVAFLKFESKFPFVKPGPMMSPKSTWGPRVDSGLPLPAKNGTTNEAFHEES